MTYKIIELIRSEDNITVYYVVNTKTKKQVRCFSTLMEAYQFVKQLHEMFSKVVGE